MFLQKHFNICALVVRYMYQSIVNTNLGMESCISFKIMLCWYTFVHTKINSIFSDKMKITSFVFTIISRLFSGVLHVGSFYNAMEKVTFIKKIIVSSVGLISKAYFWWVVKNITISEMIPSVCYYMIKYTTRRKLVNFQLIKNSKII